MEIKKFYNDGTELGIYVEINPSEYEIKLVSQDMIGSRKKLSDYISATPNAVAGINGGLFVENGFPNIIGVYRDSNGNIRGDENDTGPKILWDGSTLSLDWLKINQLGNFNWVRSAAYYGFLYNGEQSNDYLPGNEGYYKGLSERSMIGQKADGTIIIAATHKNKWMDGPLQAKVMKNLGCIIGLNLDGGKSSQLYVNGAEQIGNLRPISDAIIICEKNSTPTGSGCKMHLVSSAANLRSDVVNGSIKTTIPNGTTFEVIGLYSWNASDGYKWGYGKWNGHEGYFQYDPAVMRPTGNVEGLNYKMRLFGSAARIRSSIMGTILTTVDNYNDIAIDEFIDSIASDGYQWCRGHYGSIYGYFQYDPAVMFPTND